MAIVLKWNNTCSSGPCPICKEWFKPSWGFFPFEEGTWTPVCLECTKEQDQHMFALYMASVDVTAHVWEVLC